MPGPVRLDRRAFICGVGGVTLALPVLEAMGREVAEHLPRRFLRALHGQRHVLTQS